MEHLELVILGLLVAVAGLALFARLLHVPYPIFLVVGGLILGFLPGVPDIELPPELVLLIFLPPLLYAAAFFSSLRDLRANVRPIALLSVGLVVATSLSVAVAAHFFVGLSWQVAFVLGAIVSPTDVVAPTTILRRLGVPRRIVTIVEGENLTNDWTALVFYRFAVAAVATGTFSLWDAGIGFLLTGPGGFLVGLAVAWVIAQIRRRVDDALVEITISLFTGYAAYLAAEELGLSGVIAAVTAGVYLGWRSSELYAPGTRLQAYGVWEILQFLFNAVLFVLIGLQLPTILSTLTEDGRGAGLTAGLVLSGALVGAVVIATRLVWVFVFTYLPRWASRRIRENDPVPPWRQILIVAWSGMRGSVSLAAALAIPLTTQDGAPFPDRNILIFLTFCVILATLVLQGLSLPMLIRALGVRDDGADEKEELAARLKVAQAAVSKVDELADEEWVPGDTVRRMRGLYDYRRRRFAARFGELEGDDEDYEGRSSTFQRFQHEVLRREREELLRLRNEGLINDEVMRRVERDLDLEEARLEI